MIEVGELARLKNWHFQLKFGFGDGLCGGKGLFGRSFPGAIGNVFEKWGCGLGGGLFFNLPNVDHRGTMTTEV